MSIREEILSIASDLREGSMTTEEASNQLRELLGPVKCNHIFEEKDSYWKSCKLCGLIVPVHYGV